MSLLEGQLKLAYAHIVRCESMANAIPDAGASDHERVGLNENLIQILNSLERINPGIVEAHVRQDLKTTNVLDQHVYNAEIQLRIGFASVFGRVDDLTLYFSGEEHADMDVVHELACIRKHAGKTVNVLYLMVHREVAFLLSSRLLLLILFSGVTASCAVYLGQHATFKHNLAPAENIARSVTRGFLSVQAAAASGTSTRDSALNSIATFLAGIGTLPRAILAVTSGISVVDGLIILVRRLRT